MEALIHLLFVEVNGSYDVETWNSILETVVAGILKTTKLSDLDAAVKLAMAIVVVGSHRTEFFETVFDIICDWKNTQGRWWIIQEELIRHYFLGLLNHELVIHRDNSSAGSSRNLVVAAMKSKLKELTVLTKSVSHTMLIKRFQILKHDLLSLIDKIKFAPNMKRPLDDYAIQYPLSKFSPWFIAWAQKHIHHQKSKPPELLIVSKSVHLNESNRQICSRNKKRKLLASDPHFTPFAKEKWSDDKSFPKVDLAKDVLSPCESYKDVDKKCKYQHRLNQAAKIANENIVVNHAGQVVNTFSNQVHSTSSMDITAVASLSNYSSKKADESKLHKKATSKATRYAAKPVQILKSVFEKPLAVAKAFSDEVWEAFTPASQTECN